MVPWPNLSVTLQVIQDPDQMDIHLLAAYIHTAMLPESALVQLDSFDDWWVTASRNVGDKIFVDLGYID